MVIHHDQGIPRLSDTEIKWAIQQLAAAGLIEQDGENIALTGSGIDQALFIESRLTATERVIMIMFYRLTGSLDSES